MKAFPIHYNSASIDKWQGMDLRDYFAAKALQGILACDYSVNQEPAKLAYSYADEMMEVRNAKI